MLHPDHSPANRGPIPNDGRPIFLPGLGQGLHRHQPRLSVHFNTTNEEIQESQEPTVDVQSENSSLILAADPEEDGSYLTFQEIDETAELDYEEQPEDFSDHSDVSPRPHHSHHHHHKKKHGFFGHGKKKHHGHGEHHHHRHHDHISVIDENGEEVIGGGLEYLDVNEDGTTRRSSVLSGSAHSHRSSATAVSSSQSGSSSSGSYESEEDFEHTVFMEHLDEELKEALQDGEDFDYYGLYSHPTHDLDEDLLKENIATQKDILSRIKDQPWRMRRKLKLYRIGKVYIERYEGRLSKGRANVTNVTKLVKQVRRTLGNIVASLQPWEERIKSIENRFGSAGASFFLLLRWIIWVNIIQTALVVSFIMVPEILTGERSGTDFRKIMTDTERKTALNLDVIYKYEGFIKYTPVFYGWYGDRLQFPNGYRLPLAYFVTTICIFIHSFWVVLAKMAANVQQSSNVSSGDQFPYSLRTYSSWDFMIANRDTADNKVAAISRAYKELITDEEHKEEKENKWLRLFLRILAWFITAGLLALAAYILLQIMNWKNNNKIADPTYFESNAVSLTLKAITLVFPELFERLEFLEEYHPFTNLRLHLSRIALLALVTNYSFISQWVKEAKEATEEAEHVKEDFAWIWNKSYHQPTAWQKQIAIIHEDKEHETNSHEGEPEKDSQAHSEHNPDQLSSIEDTHQTAEKSDLVKGHDSGQKSSLTPSIHEGQPGPPPDISLADGLDSEANKPSNSPTDEYVVTSLNNHDTDQKHNHPIPNVGRDISLADGPLDLESYFGTRSTSANTENPKHKDHGITLPEIQEDDMNGTASSTNIEYPVLLNSTDESSQNHTRLFTYSTIRTTTINTWPTRRFTPHSITTSHPTTPVTEAPVDILGLKKLCWENKVAKEGLENLVTESLTGIIETLFMEFFRGLFVRFLAKCWFWDLENLPGYSNFRISENVINLITGQQMAWIGFFFAPALIPINLGRLIFLMYFRSWVTQVCDVPPETMFNTGQGNNFYFYILLLMLFISTLFVGYTVCFLPPSWSCGPFRYSMDSSSIEDVKAHYLTQFLVLTQTIGNTLSPFAAQAVDYLTSPAIVVPLLMLLFIIIFYLFTVRMALNKQTKNLRRTLEIERTEEKRKLLRQIEAKRKKEQQMLMTAAGTGDAVEISIEQARGNAETLLDKMKNRGFPPEGLNSQIAAARDSSRLVSDVTGGHHMRDAVHKVMVANTFVKILSEQSDSSTALNEDQEGALEKGHGEVDVVGLPITNLPKTKNKLKKKRKRRIEVIEEEPEDENQDAIPSDGENAEEFDPGESRY